MKQIWDERIKMIVEEAKKEWPKIRNDSSMMGFLGIYWGEGTKRNKIVSVVNNDPGIILVSWKIFNEMSNSKKEIIVRCYPEQDQEKCRLFWENY